MTPARKIDLGILASAGALLVWGGYAGRKQIQTPNSAASFAVLGGYALAVLGAYRIKPAAGIGVGVGLFAMNAANKYLAQQGRKTLPLPWVRLDLGLEKSGFDIGLDQETRAAVLAALKQEKDPAMLHTFATKLRDAGHKYAAEAIEKRAVEITPEARVGQAPSVVAEAQARLRDLGYDIAQDGILGAATVTAIKRFQSLHDLDIDGHLGPETIAALRAATH